MRWFRPPNPRGRNQHSPPATPQRRAAGFTWRSEPDREQIAVER